MAKLDQLITEGAASPGEFVTEQWWKDRHAVRAQGRKTPAKEQAKKAPQRKRA